ncbi:hypothetical protein B1F73_23685 [Pseudomonas syringae]|uniref:Phage-related protein n=1 Tax=Pseudomonas syringae TaxID=317 RepID=A0AB37ZJP0_PSESX|nr:MULTISPECIES: hypothetical protein [Pseudomonas]MBI6666982.1 hypothetical protein [Pseudomonas syringae]MBI6678654.1 hypothetical protein [Pseudomonas syringae]MBI6834968.1 hypothetical protein [Pseudomonas syringae]NAP03291.1 hypothetical protein [Pseudomonas syringae]NAP20047.1 hypothetical protein [Pseudomonas syringae]
MTQAKERPILFSAPMVRAILEGRKTVTRREVKKPAALDCLAAGFEPAFLALPGNADLSPYGRAGDRLWLRETWSDVNLQGAPGIAYRADGDVRDLMEDASFLNEDGAFNYDDPRSKPYQFACWSEDLLGGKEGRWRPSIHIPRWASRILLEITDVRVERLQDISEDQAKAEGIRLYTDHAELGEWWHVDGIETYSADPRKSFELLWTSVGGDWNANPWVWVVEFKRVRT